jgi:glutathione S-transferase
MRVVWMLEECGVDYDYVAATPHSPDILKVNPTGRVPALVADDTVIADSVAILTFLADRHGVATEQAGTLARARQDSLTQLIVEELDGALWTGTKHRFALPEEHRVPDIFSAARFEFERGINRLSEALGKGPYLMGETFTIADILAAHCLVWARSSQYPEPPDHVVAYGKRCRARPAFRAALARGKTN